MAQVTTQTIRKERQPGGDIPETVKNYIAVHDELFEASQSVAFDTKRFQRLSKKGLEEKDAEALAFLLWRARLVKRGARSLTWEQAVESAWLRDELFRMLNDRRKARIAEAQARRERLDADEFRRFDNAEQMDAFKAAEDENGTGLIAAEQDDSGSTLGDDLEDAA